MPSTTHSSSIRNLLLIIVVQLGFCMILLAEVANAARGYGTLVTLAGFIVGSMMIVGAILVTFNNR